MSLGIHDRVDAFGIRDGVAVLSIHHFGPWEPHDEVFALLERKLRHTLDHVRTPALAPRIHERIVRIELHCSEPPPEKVRALCVRHGVILRAPAG